MKKVSVLLAFVMLFSIAPMRLHASETIRVVLNGGELSFDVPPQNINGRVMVPLRAIFEAMGASVEWDGTTQTVTATKDDVTVILQVGNSAPTVNGQVVAIDQPALIVDGRTLAPLRFVAEAFGGTIDWDSGTQTAAISADGAVIPPPTPAPPTETVEIDLRGQNFTNAELAQMVASGEIPANVTSLKIDSNQLTDITPLRGLTSLTELYLQGKPGTGYTLYDENRNPITDGTQISDITPLSGLTNLTRLRLSCNPISDINPLSGLINLTYLDFFDNQISDLTPLSGLTNLTILSLAKNQISDITTLSGLTNLTVLTLADNQISDLTPLSGLTNLTVLRLATNQISDITPLSGLINLTSLEVYENPLSDITPLSSLTNLTELSLQRNQISNITPLSGLTELTVLRLSDNRISDITPLSGLTNLTNLRLDGNPITDWSPVAHVENVFGRP